MIHPFLLTACVLVAAFTCMAAAAETAAQPGPSTQPAAPQPAAPMPNMTSHTLVLLVLADNPPKLDAAASAELQKQHLAHIQFMASTGKVLVAGPFANRDDDNLRGMLIFSCDIDEARAMASDDPAVKAGRLKVVCMKWWTDQDALAFPWAEKHRAEEHAAEKQANEKPAK